MALMFHGVFDTPVVRSYLLEGRPLISLLEFVRTPQVLTPAIVGVLIVFFCRRESVRPALILLSIVLLVVTAGVPFTAGVLIGCGLVFLLALLLQTWQRRRPSSRLPMAVAWIAINGMLLPCFFTIMPAFRDMMEWGELTQCWGVGFLTLKALHYQAQVLRGGVDPRTPGSLMRCLHYLIHAPNFNLGPYQTFRQFTYEVDTCRDRLGWKSLRYGVWRIILGLAKGSILYALIQRPFFYSHGYYGPFATRLFQNLDAHTTA